MVDQTQSELKKLNIISIYN